jgi:hypothetical protein
LLATGSKFLLEKLVEVSLLTGKLLCDSKYALMFVIGITQPAANPQRGKYFQWPAEMTSACPSTTWMAVSSSMA